MICSLPPAYEVDLSGKAMFWHMSVCLRVCPPGSPPPSQIAVPDGGYCHLSRGFARSWNRFGDTVILPAGDQIRDTLERDPRWSSCLASHWSCSVQWPWWLPWWLDNHDDTLGRGSSIKGKGLLLPVIVSCWICSCELQSMLLRRYWTWSAVSFATRLLVAAPTDVVAWAHPNFRSSRTSDWNAQQGAAQLVARSTRQQLAQLYLTEQPHWWPEHPMRSSLIGSKEHPSTVVMVI